MYFSECGQTIMSKRSTQSYMIVTSVNQSLKLIHSMYIHIINETKFYEAHNYDDCRQVVRKCHSTSWRDQEMDTPITVWPEILARMMFGNSLKKHDWRYLILAICSWNPSLIPTTHKPHPQNNNGGVYVGDFIADHQFENINSSPIFPAIWYANLNGGLDCE